tara:strand:+ start:3274 stop:3519 length:246 start_codon:yes stop_codon:yes gene_type:complete
MDKIDQLLTHVTNNCDIILNDVNIPDPEALALQEQEAIQEEDFEETLLEMIEDGSIELVDINGETHYKLTEKGMKESQDHS